jgi:PIN domain nuclease of toxin-antitoxin system
VTFLLDSHILLWWLDDSPKLSKKHRDTIRNGDVAVSSVTVAELAIKASLGKLEIPDDLIELIDEMGFTNLPFTARHAAALRSLPFHHNDPFDRMLICQAQVDGLVLLTVDEQCHKYDVMTQ